MTIGTISRVDEIRVNSAVDFLTTKPSSERKDLVSNYAGRYSVENNASQLLQYFAERLIQVGFADYAEFVKTSFACDTQQ